jgi:hypothetical protein
MKWFHYRHPDLTLRTAESLDNARARNLCQETVSTFYKNLEELYQQHKYETSHVWNCDKIGVQAGHHSGTHVLAKKGADLYTADLYPNEREWMSILSCINASGESIPSFYNFRGK